MNWLPQTPVDRVPILIAVLIGWLLGWLLTRGPARRREDEHLSRISELESRWKKTDRELTDANSRIAQLQSNMADEEKRRHDLSLEKAALQENLDKLEAEKQELSSTVEARVADLQTLQSDLDDAGSRLVSVQTDAERMNATLQQDLSASRADLAEQTELSNSLHQSVVQLEADKEGLLTRLSDADAAISALEARIEAATSAGEEQTQLLANKEIALNEAYIAAARLQDRLSDRENRLALAQGELDDMRHNFVDLEHTQSDLENKLHNARGDVAGELAMLTSTMVKMKDDALKSANARIASLNREVEDLRAKVG